MVLKSRQFTGVDALRQASENDPPIRPGAKGGGVAVLQATLIRLGLDMPLSTRRGKAYPDGIFGAETERIVKTFQASFGLKPDGVAGRNTVQKLDELLLEREMHNRGSHGPAVKSKTYSAWVHRSYEGQRVRGRRAL